MLQIQKAQSPRSIPNNTNVRAIEISKHFNSSQTYERGATWGEKQGNRYEVSTQSTTDEVSARMNDGDRDMRQMNELEPHTIFFVLSFKEIKVPPQAIHH
jgi:hypothetical protein